MIDRVFRSIGHFRLCLLTGLNENLSSGDQLGSSFQLLVRLHEAFLFLLGEHVVVSFRRIRLRLTVAEIPQVFYLRQFFARNRLLYEAVPVRLYRRNHILYRFRYAAIRSTHFSDSSS